jgi:hypothetical protein
MRFTLPKLDKVLDEERAKCRELFEEMFEELAQRLMEMVVVAGNAKSTFKIDNSKFINKAQLMVDIHKGNVDAFPIWWAYGLDEDNKNILDIPILREFKEDLGQQGWLVTYKIRFTTSGRVSVDIRQSS